jgi:hypothetical protein
MTSRQGFIKSLEERAHETVFDDFLDMADYIRSIHPAPAVVLAGSVLEGHVRRLASKHGIAVVDDKDRPEPASRLGTTLCGRRSSASPSARH